MPPIRNAAIIFTEIPLVGPPEAGVHFQYDDSRTIDLDTVRHRLVVRNLAFAIDPYLRHRMRDSTMDGFAEAYEIGEPLQGYVIGQVVRSQDPSYAIGTFVLGESGLEEYTLFDDVDSLRILTDNQISLNLPLSTWAGAAGMSGQAAFYGLYHIGKPRRGDTIYISGAASTVGQIAGQLAKMEGCKVVGSASTDEKVQFLKQIGFDHAFNSKSSLLATELSSIAPIHIYWDNIGGQHLSSAIAYAADYAKFVECGMISAWSERQREIPNLALIVAKRIRLEGFIISDQMNNKAFQQEFFDTIPPMIARGDIVVMEDLRHGLRNGIKALVDCFAGQNFGKTIVQIATPI